MVFKDSSLCEPRILPELGHRLLYLRVVEGARGGSCFGESRAGLSDVRVGLARVGLVVAELQEVLQEN
jgi:hypothetical protein